MTRQGRVGWRYVVRHFSPAWFAAIMGTGAISNLFYVFPYGRESQGMKIMTLVFFLLNLCLFLLFTTLIGARFILFSGSWDVMIRHPVQSLYLGTFPMGAATLLNVAATLIYDDYNIGGKRFLYVLWGLWWFDVFICIMCCWGQVHYMMTRHEHTLERMTPVWLLPVITMIVVSSTGAILAHRLRPYSVSHALITATSAIFIVAVGLTMASMILTIYLLRCIVHGLPPKETVISTFIPLGPPGQAAYCILLAGSLYQAVLPLKEHDSSFLRASSSGDVLNGICVAVAFVLWCMDTMWMIYAILAVQEVMRQERIPFKVSAWGLIFPNGVYANLTIQLAVTFESTFFRGLGAGCAVVTFCLWSLLALLTIIAVKRGEIFDPPTVEEKRVNQLDNLDHTV